MAAVVGARPSAILALGSSMGLRTKPTLTADQLRRIYITVIRQNWHLLPEEQIIQLLGWSRQRFEFTLKEDDFLSVKLGPKPLCETLRAFQPDAAQRAQAARIRRVVREILGPAEREPAEEPFHFVGELSGPARDLLRERSARAEAGEIDLTNGWHVAEPPEQSLGPAAERLRDYLRAAMGAELGGPRQLRLEIDPAADPGGFEVDAAPDGLRIRGRDVEAVLQGIYWLEDGMEERGGPFIRTGRAVRRMVWNPRFLYSYFALYGDPLVESEVDPLPDLYLERLARTGINGVWIQAVLNTLAPSPHFPEFGARSEIRLENLRRLVERARRRGVRIYLYLNEPRAMPAAFFRGRPEMRGEPYGGQYAMCTSSPVVREWLRDSLTHVLRAAPELGGVLTITMSENHTNCFSHGGTWGVKAPRAKECPRCTRRQGWETIGELIGTVRDGVRAASRTADVIVWDWGWPDELAAKLIPTLPRDVIFQSISEWSQPVRRGGVSTVVGEYSISVVGPGPRATANWRRAAEHGIRTMAKVQFNNTWEISAVPYLPVLPLILEHCEGLAQAGISGIMPSWTCGGYPSPNLAGAKSYYFEPRQSREEILERMAAARYGRDGRADAVSAWKKFSRAFQEFPYGVAVYKIPTQHGPANLLRLRPTGYRGTVILYPQDDVEGWRGAYPAEVMRQQFARLAELWREGLEPLRAAAGKAPAGKHRFAALELAIAETCYHHFRSTANQVEFYMLRDANGSRERMAEIARDEMQLAQRQLLIVRQHAEIGYEASNHYYYRPLDLLEKVLNCRQVIAELGAKP
jgi:hypothetical protein